MLYRASATQRCWNKNAVLFKLATHGLGSVQAFYFYLFICQTALQQFDRMSLWFAFFYSAVICRNTIDFHSSVFLVLIIIMLWHCYCYYYYYYNIYFVLSTLHAMVLLLCVGSGGSIVFVSSIGGYNPFEVRYFGDFSNGGINRYWNNYETVSQSSAVSSVFYFQLLGQGRNKIPITMTLCITSVWGTWCHCQVLKRCHVIVQINIDMCVIVYVCMCASRHYYSMLLFFLTSTT